MHTDYELLVRAYTQLGFPYQTNDDLKKNPTLDRLTQLKLREINASTILRDLETGVFYCFDKNGAFLKRFSPSQLEEDLSIGPIEELAPNRGPGPRNLLAGCPVSVHFQTRTPGLRQS